VLSSLRVFIQGNIMSCVTSKIVAAAVIAVLVSSAPVSACNTSGANGIAGQVVTSTMSLQQGKSCMIRHFTTTSGNVGNRQFPTTDVSLTSSPSKGKVDIEGNRIIFRARAGTSGSDSFAYRTQIKSGKTFDYRVAVDIY
jgi:predicted small secreted protein